MESKVCKECGEEHMIPIEDDLCLPCKIEKSKK
jgi:hypothetical protein